MGLFSKKLDYENLEIKDIEEVEEKKDEVQLSVEDLLQKTITHFIVDNPKTIGLVNRGQKSRESLYEDVERFLKLNKATSEIIDKVKIEISKYIWGYGKLDDLINNDDDVSDIKTISHDNIRVKRLGKRETSNVRFKDTEELNNYINFVAFKNQSTLADINSLQIFTDNKTSDKFIVRINISTNFVNSVPNHYMHIRKIAKNKKDLNELKKLNLLTEEEAIYLKEAMDKGLSIIFTGKGASGKTTLMNALIDEIPHDKSGLVIQESEELFSDTHPDLMFQKVKYAKGEGKIQYTLKDFAINGLLIDLDYFVIGEIKGAEALYFLNACYTGHVCLGSVHGNSSEEALNKLADYMKYESNYSQEELLSMIKDIDLVVYMKDFKTNEISEVSGFDSNKKQIVYNNVFKNGKRINQSCEKITKKLNQ